MGRGDGRDRRAAGRVFARSQRAMSSPNANGGRRVARSQQATRSQNANGGRRVSRDARRGVETGS